MIIAVTGANGFVGRHFCREALANGVDVRPISRHHDPTIPAGVTTDYATPESIERVLRGTAAVIHLAARAHIIRERSDDADRFRDANLELTKRVALAAVTAGVRRLVFVSSAGVLGASSTVEGFADGSVPRPSGAYARSKLEAEHWLEGEISNRLDLVVVRPPLVYGPDPIGNFGRLMNAVIRGLPLPVRALRAPRSLIGVRNLSHFLCLCATHPDAPGRPLLIADSETTSIADLVDEIAGIAGRRALTFPIPPRAMGLIVRMLGRSADATRLTEPFVVASSARIRELKWEARYSRAEELTWAVKTYMECLGQ